MVYRAAEAFKKEKKDHANEEDPEEKERKKREEITRKQICELHNKFDYFIMMAINARLFDTKPVADKTADSDIGWRASEQNGGSDLIERFSEYKRLANEADRVKLQGGNQHEFDKLVDEKRGNMGEKWLARLQKLQDIEEEKEETGQNYHTSANFGNSELTNDNAGQPIVEVHEVNSEDNQLLKTNTENQPEQNKQQIWEENFRTTDESGRDPHRSIHSINDEQE